MQAGSLLHAPAATRGVFADIPKRALTSPDLMTSCLPPGSHFHGDPLMLFLSTDGKTNNTVARADPETLYRVSNVVGTHLNPTYLVDPVGGGDSAIMTADGSASHMRKKLSVRAGADPLDNAPHTTPAPFIAFEGVDGAGKSSLVSRVAEFLGDEASGIIFTREPGGSPDAERMRNILKAPEESRSRETEILLLNAARRQHLDNTIRPALNAGRPVVTDRFLDSTHAFQRASAGFHDHWPNERAIDRLHTEFQDGFLPHLTVMLDGDPIALADRASLRSGSRDVMEDVPAATLMRRAEIYRERAASSPERYLVEDAHDDPDAIARRVAATLCDFIRTFNEVSASRPDATF